MTELIEFVLELVCSLVDLAAWWRFSLCLFVSILVCLGLWQIRMPDAVRIGAAIPVVLTGVVLGIVWERGG